MTCNQITDWPDRVTHEIFAGLLVYDLFSCSRVCKHWNKLIDAPWYWRSSDAYDRKSAGENIRRFQVISKNADRVATSHTISIDELGERLRILTFDEQCSESDRKIHKTFLDTTLLKKKDEALVLYQGIEAKLFLCNIGKCTWEDVCHIANRLKTEYADEKGSQVVARALRLAGKETEARALIKNNITRAAFQGHL